MATAPSPHPAIHTTQHTHKREEERENKQRQQHCLSVCCCSKSAKPKSAPKNLPKSKPPPPPSPHLTSPQAPPPPSPPSSSRPPPFPSRPLSPLSRRQGSAAAARLRLRSLARSLRYLSSLNLPCLPRFSSAPEGPLRFQSPSSCLADRSPFSASRAEIGRISHRKPRRFYPRRPLPQGRD